MLTSRNELDKFETVAMDITHLLEKNSIDLNSAKHILWSILYSCYEYEFLEELASKRGISAAFDVYKMRLLRILENDEKGI